MRSDCFWRKIGINKNGFFPIFFRFALKGKENAELIGTIFCLVGMTGIVGNISHFFGFVKITAIYRKK